MTLSVLWRSDGRLHLASDSRISFGDQGSSDVGVKVMRLPLRILGTDTDDDGELKVIFDRTYGFCYAGSLVNAGTFKSLIEDLLLDVQYLDEAKALSFLDLCEFLRYYCGKVSTEVCSYLAGNGYYGFFFAGYCPREKRLRAALFKFSQADGKSIATFSEVAINNGSYIAIGKGAAEADAVLAGKLITQRTVLLAINQVIDEQKVPSVGGDIQYGTFKKDGNFAVSGLQRISMEELEGTHQSYGPSEFRIFRYRGFQLYDGWDHTVDKFWPTTSVWELVVPSNSASHNWFVESCEKTGKGAD